MRKENGANIWEREERRQGRGEGEEEGEKREGEGGREGKERERERMKPDGISGPSRASSQGPVTPCSVVLRRSPFSWIAIITLFALSSLG